MKKRIMALALALSLVFSMFTVFAVSSSAYDLSGLTLAVTEEEKAAAQAAKNELSKPAERSDMSTNGTYLGYFLFYGTQITTAENNALPEVIRFKNSLQRCEALMATDTLYLSKYYGLEGEDPELALQAGWNAARENIPVSNGWDNLRKKLIKEKCNDLWKNEIGVDANHIACPYYTTTSWAVYEQAIGWGDLNRNKCTDVEGAAALAAITTAYAALEKNPDYVGPVNAKNKEAYDFCTQNLAGMPLYQWYVTRMKLFTDKSLWSDVDLVQAYLDKADEADMLFIDDYNDGYDYTAWITYDTETGLPADMAIEKDWVDARHCAYIGPVLKEHRYAIDQTILPSYFYTADSWSTWLSVQPTLSLLIDDTSNMAVRKTKDVDGKAAIDAYQAAVNELEPILVEATTQEDKNAAQAAKDALTASASNPTGNYFGWYVGYSEKFTLDKYTSLAEVVAFKNQIELVKYLLKADKLYLAQFYGLTEGTDYNLEALWIAARAKAPVSNNLITMRNDYLTANVTDWLTGYQDGFSTAYTDESFKAIRNLIDRADANKNAYNDAQGDQFMADLAAAVTALVPRDPAIADKDNYRAYMNLGNILTTYAPLVNRFKLEASKAKSEFIAFNEQITTMDELSIAAYDANTNYKAYTEATTEPLWMAARNSTYMGPALITYRDAILATVGDESEYTADTWASWIAAKTDIINAIDDLKNSARATDEDGKEAIDTLQDAVDQLVKKTTPLDGLTVATTEDEKDAAQAAKTTLNTTVEGTSTGTYFGYYVDYMNRITLDSNKALAPVKKYMAQLDLVKALLESDTLYLVTYYGLEAGSANDLEALWKAARDAALLNDGLTNARNEYLTANVKDWLDAYNMKFSCAYTNESFAAIRTMIDKGDEIKRKCTDVEALAYLEELKTAVGTLVPRNPEIDLTNYKAYLTLVDTYNTFAPLLNKFTLDDSKATAEYIAFNKMITEIETYSINDYDAAITYTAYTSEAAEALWIAARDKAYMGKGLADLRDAMIAALGDGSKYTEESWNNWLSVKTDLINAIDAVKNSPTAKDKNGKEAIDDLKEAIDALVLKTILGDATGDGTVDIADAVLAFQYLAGKATIADQDAFVAGADIDKNGSVTLADVIKLFKFVAGKTTEL